MLFKALNFGASLVQRVRGAADGKPTVSQAQYDDLLHHFLYALETLKLVKKETVNNAEVVSSVVSGVSGFIARDDEQEEIVVAFRTGVVPQNGVFGVNFLRSAFNSEKMPAGEVHTGWHAAWNTVCSEVLEILEEELAEHPHYTVTFTGHSFGAVIATMGGIDAKWAFPNKTVRLYTYGAPRVGNAAFARGATDVLGVNNVFRVVHGYDFASNLPPALLGWQHFGNYKSIAREADTDVACAGTEYWQLDPPGPDRTFMCNDAGSYMEDRDGSRGVGGLPHHHLIYFGIPLTDGVL
ncbi:Alpha/Beta hydrolase protein [Mycena galopus ATCC 62051]|nr:Alpha/Beta hydrolase protein [Mycena galopus ATCC 62051]